jgi:HK97 family phage portal protein
MGFFDKAVRLLRPRAELRSSLENPQTPLSFPAEWLLDIFNGGRTDSGIRVSELTAMQVSTVLACVNIITSAIATLPLNVYEQTVSGTGRLGKSLALGHDLFDVLHNEPNEEMTSFSWRKTLQCHMLLWGNGYAEIERNNANEIVGLWPRNPARTRPVRLTAPATIEGTRYPTGTLVYETNETVGDSQMGQDGTDSLDNKLAIRRIILAEDMIHIPGLSFDGRLGQSTVWLARQTIGLALATEKYGAKFFGNSARPAGVLEIPGTMEPKALENLRRSWAEAHGGENMWKTAVLEAGVKYQKVGATPDEGQYIETRKYVRTEIATIFNVPPHMVGEATTGKSTVEQSSIELVLYTLDPWITAWQQELRRKLMPKKGRTSGKYFVKFDVRRLLYPDAASRSKFYATGRQWGFLNGNDIRELEDMDPIPGGAGSAYWMPVNMMDAGDVHQIVPPGAPAPDGSVADLKAKQAALAKQQGGGNEPTPGKGQKTGMPEVPPKNGKQPAKGKKKGRSLTFGAGGGIYPLLDLAELVPGKDGPFAMRHGSTEYNAEDKYREWTDVDLDDKGRAIVERAAQYLLGRGITKIYCTDLKRGHTTAEIVSKVLGGIPIEYTDGLNTWKHGFGGKTKKEAGAAVAYYVEHPTEAPANGESLDTFIKRSQEEIDSHLSEPTSLLITSGSNLASWNQDEENVDKALAGKSEIGPGGFGVIKDDNIMVLYAGDQDGKHPS